MRNLKSNKILITYNPHSGKGNAEKYAKRLSGKLWAFNFEIEMLATQSVEEVYLFCERVKDEGAEYGLIVVIGGDGTLSYWVDATIKNGLNSIPLYPFGAGTANDLSAYFKTGKSVKRAVKKITETGSIFPVDCLKINDERYAAYAAGSGAFTNGVMNYGKRVKKLFGKVAYGVKAFFEALKMKTQRLRVILDGKEIQLEAYFFLVSNIERAGTRKRICKGADPQDGYLNFIAVKGKRNFFTKLHVLACVNSGRTTKTNKYFHSAKFKTLEVSLFENKSGKENKNFAYTDIDGNRGDPLPLKVEVVTGKLNLFV